MSFPYFSISADKSVKYAENANGATRIHSLGNNHDFMLHWDDHDAWLYINSIDNYIKLGPVGNDLSKKQDVNQYISDEVSHTEVYTPGDTYQILSGSFSVKKQGYRAIAMMGYYVNFAGTNSVAVQDIHIDLSTEVASYSVITNNKDGGTMTFKMYVTYAPLT